ncbi:aspartate/tyrosine/aromatic aminotransferase [Microthyrium microscopicum]|uniref:Aspartate/tyrosine/aromatic aminotransferase n=1 Tax=Microthyrium microscopicum TaxID=703497 RepID=A0A6A6U5J5_9PEZI|nr:aspartate/tyrosine/aromatic aminotransferase [Microthyrium microscopicum]
MVKFEHFAVERWMDDYETKSTHNLAETCCASISLDDLQALSEVKGLSLLSHSAKMTYGEIPGLKSLRTNLANLYSSKTSTPLPAENILITPGAIMANHLIFYSLVGPGDHVICHYPTYQQLFDTPRSLGAEVDLWKTSPEKNWSLDIDELEKMIKKNTKLIVINNPQNPTGAVVTKSNLEKLVAIASAHNITVMSDEVYRPIFHGIGPMDKEFPPSILSLGYNNTIAVGSLSKAYSLAGIRTGWIASRSPEMIARIMNARHYTTISVSQLDSAVASYALAAHTIHALIGRNIKLAKNNLEILDKWVSDHREFCDYVKPVAGTTAFIRFKRDSKPLNSETLCRRLVEEEKVLWVPGSHSFGPEFKGFVRIGYVCETEDLKAGLDKASSWLKKEVATLPLDE